MLRITYNHHYSKTFYSEVYLCPCLGLQSLFMSYLFYLFVIFILIFIAINHMTSLKQVHLFFLHFLEHLLFLDDSVDKERE